MNILVAGGAGFVGSHLCERLLSEGNHVTCLDNLYTGQLDNIEGLLGNPKFTFIKADVREDLRDLRNKFNSDGNSTFDCIYNLACPASPPDYQKNPIMTIETSYYGSENLLKLAKEAGSKILLASTSEIYGDPTVHPQNESYWGNVNPIGIRACYDEGKRIAETLFMNYARHYGVDAKIVRIFNTYGPRMRENDGRVVSNFIICALRGESLKVYGDGSQTRSFQYVDDLIDGLLAMMNTPKGFTGPVNLGNPSEYTILELAHMINRMCDRDANFLTFLELPQDDPTRRRPDISLAKSALDWSPKIPISNGLKNTINYFKRRI